MKKFALALLGITVLAFTFSAGIYVGQHYLPKGAIQSVQSAGDIFGKARDLGVEPSVGSDGNVIGFKVMNVPAGSIYAKLGFQSGDIITTVNGIKLDSVPAAMGLYQELRNARQADVGVLRGGQTISITVHSKDFRQ